MRITFTNFSLALPHAECQDRGSTNQSCESEVISSTATHRQSKLTVILFALIMIVVSSAIAQPPANMTAGNYTLTGSINPWNDPGGAGGSSTCPGTSGTNYPDNCDITETMTANAGQRISLSWNG